MITHKTRQSGWTYEKDLWDRLSTAGRDLSWKNLSFDENSRHLVPEHDGGVYLICAKPPPGFVEPVPVYTVLYAGKVESTEHGLRRRFLEHLRRPSPILRIFRLCYFPHLYFWCVAIHDQSRISEIEALLIETFNPPCNQRRAPGTDVLLAKIGIGQKLALSV